MIGADDVDRDQTQKNLITDGYAKMTYFTGIKRFAIPVLYKHSFMKVCM